MNYKSIIKSQELRIKILSALSWIPDNFIVPLMYLVHNGRQLNLKTPARFTEKIQLYKLKYKNPLMKPFTDKYEVRKVIKEKGFEDILIPLIGVYDSAKEINFDKLPNKFVAKTTDGGGSTRIIICRDKEELDKQAFINKLDKWLSLSKAKPIGREWAYENGYPRRIVIEQLIESEGAKDLVDYKFYCFNGIPVYCQIIGNRSTKETIDFFDMNWNHMPFRGLNPACGGADILEDKPDNFDEMKKVASDLSKDFPFVRVDLYNVKGKIYFGELTFYPASGFGQFTPDIWDFKLGEMFDTHIFI